MKDRRGGLKRGINMLSGILLCFIAGKKAEHYGAVLK
jgi:hypothetical protein